jgi:peptidoglycan/LPS O-acetylase OafA/YrhL
MRNKRLDILRCVAVVMVTAHHTNIYPLATKMGWVGVDFFFVLSGFLISGLLYSEYKKRRTIGVGRFLIRRGLKIYPSFYFFLLVSLVAQLALTKSKVPLRPYLYEILFIQNYHFGVWFHTWSLAVEEHFYIAVALLLLALARFTRHRENPFQVIPWIFVFVAITCLLLRILTIEFVPAASFRTPLVMNATHCRIDGLFFGVFLGYLYHFRPEVISNLLSSARNRIGIAVLTVALLSTCYFFTRDDHFLLAFGLTFLYLGFGGLLILTLETKDILSGASALLAERVGLVCAFVGMYSYSIYLWHFMLILAGRIFLEKFGHIYLPALVRFIAYLLGSIVLGIFFARLIEFPVLRFRDRIFPGGTQSPVSPDPSLAPLASVG